VKIREFSGQLWLPRPRTEVFAYFSDAGNLEEITPPWMHFHVLTPKPIPMHPGARIDYRLRVRGLPLRWQSEITVWQPEECFVDEQRRGPYRLWRHRHEFHERNGGTLCLDHVQYAVPFDWLTHRWLVRPDIERIFAYRTEVLQRLFGQGRSPA
jgi:ligand-binding SRPBCC domain-containing protein